jgi:hypothetical protein
LVYLLPESSKFFWFSNRLLLSVPDKEELEDTKEVIRIRKPKKNRQHNSQKKKDKRTNNDLQNITHKTKD